MTRVTEEYIAQVLSALPQSPVSPDTKGVLRVHLATTDIEPKRHFSFFRLFVPVSLALVAVALIGVGMYSFFHAPAMNQTDELDRSLAYAERQTATLDTEVAVMDAESASIAQEDSLPDDLDTIDHELDTMQHELDSIVIPS